MPVLHRERRSATSYTGKITARPGKKRIQDPIWTREVLKLQPLSDIPCS